MKTLTTHYIDGAFVESHGREVMDVIRPTNGKLSAASRWAMRRIPGAPSLQPSAHLPLSAERRSKSVRRFCADYIRPLRRESTS
jgi:aldehyde dehydrogenase (NAD+)